MSGILLAHLGLTETLLLVMVVVILFAGYDHESFPDYQEQLNSLAHRWRLIVLITAWILFIALIFGCFDSLVPWK